MRTAAKAMEPQEAADWLYLLLVRDLAIFNDLYVDANEHKVYAQPRFIFADMEGADEHPDKVGFIVNYGDAQMDLRLLQKIVVSLVHSYLTGGREIVLENTERNTDDNKEHAPGQEVVDGDVPEETSARGTDSESGGSVETDSGVVADETSDTSEDVDA